MGGALTHLGKACFHVGTIADNLPEAVAELGAEGADAALNRERCCSDWGAVQP